MRFSGIFNKLNVMKINVRLFSAQHQFKEIISYFPHKNY